MNVPRTFMSVKKLVRLQEPQKWLKMSKLRTFRVMWFISGPQFGPQTFW